MAAEFKLNLNTIRGLFSPPAAELPVSDVEMVHDADRAYADGEATVTLPFLTRGHPLTPCWLARGGPRPSPRGGAAPCTAAALREVAINL